MLSPELHRNILVPSTLISLINCSGYFTVSFLSERPLTYGVAERLSCLLWLDLRGQSSFPILLFLAFLVAIKASQPYNPELSALGFKIVALTRGDALLVISNRYA